MPTRLLKDSICTSKDINRLTPDEEVFFYRLIVNCDDYGYLDADPDIIRAKLYPRRLDVITSAIICKHLQSLVIIGMVKVFEHDGSFFLAVSSWEKHQQVRAKRRKYPEANGNSTLLQASDITCKHLLSPASKCARNPIQSNPDDIRDRGGVGGVTPEYIQTIKDQFPDIDISMEWERCKVWWNESHKPMKRPKSALLNWLTNAKKRGPDSRGGNKSAGMPGNEPAGALEELQGLADGGKQG